jgi:ribosomal protein S10
VEFLRVLLDNKVGPILMIAFTNHALDHILSSVLDTRMTKKIVRLGSRSADERIAKFSIENMEMVQGKSRLDYTFSHHHRELKHVEEELKKLMDDFLKVAIASDRITGYLELQYPEHHEHIINPPPWISIIKAVNLEDSDGPWKRVGRNGQGDDLDTSMYAYWMSCEDLRFVDSLSYPRAPSPNHHVGSAGQNMFEALTGLETLSQHNDDSAELEDDQSDSDDERGVVEELWQRIPVAQEPEVPIETSHVPSLGVNKPSESSSNSNALPGSIRPCDLRDPASFFFAHGCDTVPVVPTSDRALDELLDCGDIWAMSQSERRQLHSYWVEVVRADLRQNQLEDFERLRRKHADKLRKFNEGKDE